MQKALSILSAFFLLLACGLIALGLAFRYAASPGPLSAPKLVVIAPGQGVQAIAAHLQQEGVIEVPLLFTGMATLTGERARLKAGEYEFAARISLLATLHKIARGDVYVRKITVPEGWSSAQVRQALIQADGLTGDLPDAIEEGTILPETYLFRRGETRAGVLARMQAAMEKAITDAWANRQVGMPITSPRELTILASVIEKETGIKAERTRVAGVFMNRLRLNMKLQSDPTVIYAMTEGKTPLGRPLLIRDLETVNSRYNTYMYEGLPIGPIANPGRAALKAAANPDASDELYFVADGTGGHAFARTLDEHNANVARWRRLQVQQKAAP